MREPPRRTRAIDTSHVYSIEKIAGRRGSTCYFTLIERLIFQLDGHDGLYVRYNNRYHPLHEKKELPSFVALQNEAKTILVHRGSGKPFDLEKHAHRHFVLKWDAPLGRYRD